MSNADRAIRNSTECFVAAVCPDAHLERSYHNTRAEIKETEAEVKNFDTEMQKLEEAHRSEIKVYIQKVKHIEYEHQLNCNNVAGEAGTAQANMGEEK